MRKILAPLALLLASHMSMAQSNAPGLPPQVSISARGTDVRDVLVNLFTQVNKNVVVVPGIRFALFLKLDNVEFDEALAIVCKMAELKWEVQNGIYYVSRKPAAPKPIVKPEPPKPKKVAAEDLAKKVNTDLKKATLKEVFAAFSEQTGVKIEIEEGVPNYKMDCALKAQTLKYALDRVTKAAKLIYKFTDHATILIAQNDGDRIALASAH